MAAGEITGETEDELKTRRGRYYNTTMYHETGVSFEDAYCLTRIGKQPDDYDGPTRFCTRRALWKEEGEEKHPACQFHGGCCNEGGTPENLEPYTAAITHGLYAEDENLRADFNDEDQQLYDSILSWADIYDFPPREEDPARYEMLEMYAIEKVRSVRTYEYIYDEGEVVEVPERGPDGGIVGYVDQENTLSEPHRLQQKLLMDILKEMGMTAKARNKMDALESSASAGEQLAEVAKEAITGSDAEYDPDAFGDDDDD